MRDKIRNAKQWCVDHQDEIVIAGCYAVYIGFCVGAVALAVKAQREGAAQYLETATKIRDASVRGDMVLLNPDGTFWIIDKAELS